MGKQFLPDWVCDWCSNTIEPEDCRFVNWDGEQRLYEWLLCPDCMENYQDENEIVPVYAFGPMD